MTSAGILTSHDSNYNMLLFYTSHCDFSHFNHSVSQSTDHFSHFNHSVSQSTDHFSSSTLSSAATCHLHLPQVVLEASQPNLSPDLFSKYSLVTMFLCYHAVSAWQCPQCSMCSSRTSSIFHISVAPALAVHQMSAVCIMTIWSNWQHVTTNYANKDEKCDVKCRMWKDKYRKYWLKHARTSRWQLIRREPTCSSTSQKVPVW